MKPQETMELPGWKVNVMQMLLQPNNVDAKKFIIPWKPLATTGLLITLLSHRHSG